MIALARHMAPYTTAKIPSRQPKGAWRMVVLAFMAQNFAIGLSLGAFGVSVLAIESTFHTKRTLASLGGSLVVLSLGVLAPVVAVLLERYTIRRTMLAGVVLGSIGYVALAVAPNIWLFLAAFALLVGPRACMAGNLPGSVLLNNWFAEDKGRAIGLMMMPLFIMLVRWRARRSSRRTGCACSIWCWPQLIC